MSKKNNIRRKMALESFKKVKANKKKINREKQSANIIKSKTKHGVTEPAK